MTTATTVEMTSGKSGLRNAELLKWLRKVHGWIGLWGAILGLLFGTTGVLQNHRAVMKLPAAKVQESTVQLKLPAVAPADAQAWATWLQTELNLERPANRVREEPARSAAWGDKAIRQPAHWLASYATPRTNVQADYWVGNDFTTVRRGESNLFATLSNLHKGVGASVGWILLADTIGGAMILLSLTGVVLWTQLNRRRLLGATIAIVSCVVTVSLALNAL